MRENRPYGSEGGGIEINQSCLPLSTTTILPAKIAVSRFRKVVSSVTMEFKQMRP